MQPQNTDTASDPTLNPQSAAGAMGEGAQGDAKAQLDETTQALSGGVIALPLDTAATMVARWQQALEASGDPELQAVAANLSDLGRQLNSGTPDAASVAALLVRLGSQVSRVAAGQSGIVAAGLTQLGSTLSSAGASLAA